MAAKKAEQLVGRRAVMMVVKIADLMIGLMVLRVVKLKVAVLADP